MERRLPLGTVSFVGTFALFVVLGWTFGSFGEVLRDMRLFLNGNVMEISQAKGEYLSLVKSIFPIVVLDLLFGFASLFAIAAVLGKAGEHKLTRHMLPPQGAKLFKMFFLMVVGEELLARLFFLGLLTLIPGLEGTAGFYLLFLAGNAFWSWIHIFNFEKEDQNLLRVIPQFIGGIFFSYAYYKWGFAGAILSHFASNAVLFSMMKEQRFGTADVLTFVYTVLAAALGYWCLRKPVTDGLLWLQAGQSFSLPGWSFWDYYWLFILFSMSIAAIAELLLYDKSDLRKMDRKSPQKARCEAPSGIAATGALAVVVSGILALVMALMSGFWRLANFFLKFVARRAATRAGILGVFICFANEARSANAVARSFWVGVPSGAMLVAIALALPYYQSIGFLLMTLLVELPLLVIKKIDN